MSDNDDVSIIDPPPAQTPRQPASAPSTPSRSSSAPSRPKRKARALSVDEDDDDDDVDDARPKTPRRAAKKKALVPPGGPTERRSTVFLEEPPATRRPTTPAPTRRTSAASASADVPLPVPVARTPAPDASVRPSPIRAISAPDREGQGPVPSASTGDDGTTTTAVPPPSQEDVPTTNTEAVATTSSTGDSAPSPPTAPPPTQDVEPQGQVLPSREEWAILRAELAEVRTLLLGSRAPASVPSTTILEPVDVAAPLEAPQADPFSILPLRTIPNGRGDMPPASVCHLSSAMFPAGKKSTTEYHPPQVHSLAAHRLYKELGYPPFEGRYSSATSFVLALLESPAAKFPKSVATAVALYSGRLGSRGASVMMFAETSDDAELERGSTNQNFDINFGASLDPSPVCNSYDDLLSALNGLGAIANEMWYDHGRKLVSRLRTFVAKNKSADPSGTEERIRLTCQFVNKFLGRAMGWLQSESDQWWCAYSDELRSIDYASLEWSMAVLNSMTSTIRREASRTTHLARRAEPRLPQRDQARDLVKRPAGMPLEIKALIPRNANGEEPCLRHFSGAGCPGRDGMCTNKKLLHKWPTKLPTPLLDWTRANFKRPDGTNSQVA